MQMFAITPIHTLAAATYHCFLGCFGTLKPRVVGYFRTRRISRVVHRDDTFTIHRLIRYYMYSLLAKSIYRDIYISYDVSELGRKHRGYDAVSTLRVK